MNDDHGTVLSPAEVRFERLLPGPIETVWAFITDSQKRGEWLAAGPMELRVGGKVRLRFKHSELSPHKAEPPERFREMDAKGHEATETITELDPPRRLAFTWGQSEVLFELTPKGDRVLLILTHRKLPNRNELVGSMGGWHTHLNILVERANGGTPAAFWDVFRRIDGTYESRVPR